MNNYAIWHSSVVTPEYTVGADFSTPPTWNPNNLGFPKKEISKFGLKRSTTFYDQYDKESDSFINPLLSVSWKTIFDETGEPKYQVRHASFKMTDGSWSQSHESVQPIRKPKVFLQKMRSRVIEELIDLADKFGFADKLKALYERHPTEIYIYKEGGSPKFRAAISTSEEEWLNLPSTDGRTVRDVIFQYLSIGVVEIEAN